ncbi:hypothetical protein EON71_00895 [bacterium]|nr:MAG: hypothetical protein EON71_00895 [bacterium]
MKRHIYEVENHEYQDGVKKKRLNVQDNKEDDRVYKNINLALLLEIMITQTKVCILFLIILFWL